MLDFDLAAMYGVETRVLNQAVKLKITGAESGSYRTRETRRNKTAYSCSKNTFYRDKQQSHTPQAASLPIFDI